VWVLLQTELIYWALGNKLNQYGQVIIICLSSVHFSQTVHLAHIAMPADGLGGLIKVGGNIKKKLSLLMAMIAPECRGLASSRKLSGIRFTYTGYLRLRHLISKLNKQLLSQPLN